uniref:Uncharacterized protein n=1 Tax=viral metagenome TaxID=1070528 RepID=A0A6C0KLN8_9ZZZZ
MASFIMNKIPEAAWKSMGIELVNQVCNITYYDKTNGDKEQKRHPKREILNIITDFLQNNINLREANQDASFKAEFFKAVAESVKPPIAKMYENDLMAIRLMEGILKEYPYIFMNIINVVAQQTSDEVSEKKEPFITLFMKKITTYINVENEVSQTINIDTELSSPAPENHEKLHEIENEDISGVQDTLIATIKKYGYLKNADNIDYLNKVSNDEVIKHIDSLIDAIVTASEEKNKTEASTSALSAILNNNLNINPVASIVQGAVGNMPKEFVEKIFATLDTSDDKPYSEIKKDIYKTILSALRYHLERPEGRQMYLRQLEPILRNYAVKTLMNDDITVICIFQLIRDSPKINTLLKKTVEGAILTSALNFTNPSFQDMQRFRGGNGETNQDGSEQDASAQDAFEVNDNNNDGVPIAVPINSEVNDKKSEFPTASAPIAVPYAPDNYNESYNMSKIISAYEGTFAYAVYQLLDAEIKTIVKSDDPIAKIYKDLDQFRVPTLVKQNKNAIDYAKTMCSPGMMKKEMNRINTIKASAPPLPAPVNNGNTTIEASVATSTENNANVTEKSTLAPTVNNTYVTKEPAQTSTSTENNTYGTEKSTLAPTVNNTYVTKEPASIPTVKPKWAENLPTWITNQEGGKGGNTHKTYRKMTQKRHKYTRKT